MRARASLAAALFLCGCSGNIKRVAEVHVADGSTDTRDHAVDVRIPRTVSFPESGVVFDNEFAGGAFVTAAEKQRDGFELLIAPENVPVNDSAWYAFRVASTRPAPARTISVRLVYRDGTHRYDPKISWDGEEWTALDKSRFSVSTDKSAAVLELPVGDRPLWVAAQELLTSEAMSSWIAKVAALPFVKTAVIGQSALGKDLPLLSVTEAAGERKYLIILGRQHPPEATGSIALMAFVETLCGDDPLAREFRRRYETVVIPMINPDGVDAGHWRHNRRGVDLNRDWEFFRQKETRAVSDELLKLKGREVVFGIDFHSTFKDVFYVLQDDVPVTSKGLTESWIKAIAAGIPDYSYRVQPVSSTVPAASIWLNKTFGIPTVTYEVGDETDRRRMREVARAAAEALMRLLPR